MLSQENYRSIFYLTESNLIKIGSEIKSVSEIKEKLNEFKRFETKQFSDAEYYEKLTMIVFYSGFRAATVTAKKNIILSHFPNYQTVAEYNEKNTAEILADSNMIRNTNKIQSCINNAKVFKKIIENFGSFQRYVESFLPNDSFENLLLFKEEIQSKFSGLGNITAYHFLTDIGLSVLKPDRVICRIFERLGLIENEKQLLKTVIHGRKFAEATKLPIRYIDIIFVAYGQMESSEFGIKKGICLENKPSCHKCTLTNYCCYYKSKNE